MQATPAKIPQFQTPQETISPQIRSLLEDRVVVEDGVQFSAY